MGADMEYGSFYHKYLCVNIPHFTERALDRKQISKFLKATPDVDARVHRALSDVTAVHEFRHFHDCFGTRSGYTQFNAHHSRLIAFAEILNRLRKDKVKLQLPLGDWAMKSSCPDYVKEFSRRIRNGRFLERAFNGSLPIIRRVGLESEPYVSIKYGGKVVLPAFPLSIKVIGLDKNDAAIGTEFETHFVPIGFEQVLEGNAQAIQRTVLESVWPSDVVDRVWEAMTVSYEEQIDADFLFKPDEAFIRLPYNITDFTLSKYLRKKFGITSFPRDRLLDLSDRALMVGSCVKYAEFGKFSPPGGAFVTIMEGASWKRKSDRQVFPDMDFGGMLAEAVKAIKEGPNLVDFLPARSISDILSYILCYAQRFVVAPIFEARLKSDNRVMRSGSTYLRDFGSLPSPPMVVSRNGISANAELPKDFIAVWSKFVMFGELAEQIWNDESLLSCPRAYESIPGLKYMEMFHPTGCDSQISSRACLTWDSYRRTSLPKCYFSFLTEMLQLH